MSHFNNFFLLLSVIFLTSCLQTGNQMHSGVPIPPRWQEYKDEEYSFAINAPNTFELGKHAIQGVIQGPAFLSDDSEIRIFPVNNNNCSNLGVSVEKIIMFENGQTAKWGKVDFWDDIEVEGWQYDNADKVLCKPMFALSYAFCSEKNGKTVLICLSQVTDDPDLAKQIFETFRWTEK